VGSGKGGAGRGGGGEGGMWAAVRGDRVGGGEGDGKVGRARREGGGVLVEGRG